jgi:ketosteroid isomerase-like protein
VPSANLDADAAAVIAVCRRVVEAMDAHDLAAAMALHDQSDASSAILPGMSHAARGWQAVEKSLQRRVEEYTHSRSTIEDPRVSLFGNLAVATYRQQIRGRVHDIDFDWNGVVTDILVRAEGGWLIRHHHASDAP